MAMDYIIRSPYDKKIVFCISLDSALQAPFKYFLDHAESLKKFELHFLHVFEITYYNNEFSQFSWPSEESYPEIQAKVENYMNQFAQSFLPKDSKFEKHCLFSEDPKSRTVHFLEELGADQVVVGTRGLHGIKGVFSSSFAEYLVKHSPCSLLVLR